MPKLQKVSEKVFAEIAETPQKKGSYDSFLNIDKILGITESEQLKDLKEQYLTLVNETRGTISTLANLEEIIVQLRCKEAINSELRLSLSRNYIYARSIFYRRDNQINDIRVVVGTTEDWGEGLDSLLRLPGFVELCKTKLEEAMDKEINSNVYNLKIEMKV